MMRGCQLWAFWPCCEPHQINGFRERVQFLPNERIYLSKNLLSNILGIGNDGPRIRFPAASTDAIVANELRE